MIHTADKNGTTCKVGFSLFTVTMVIVEQVLNLATRLIWFQHSNIETMTKNLCKSTTNCHAVDQKLLIIVKSIAKKAPCDSNI